MSNDVSKSFDQLLDANRQTLEHMIQGVGGGPSRASGQPGTLPVTTPPVRLEKPISSSTPGPASAPAKPRSTEELEKVKHDLTGKFGEHWKFEVVERRLEGSQVIVLGKLTLTESNLTQTQFGQSRIKGAGGSGAKAQVNGIPFSFHPEGGPSSTAPVGDSSAIEAAYQIAEARALANCAALV